MSFTFDLSGGMADAVFGKCQNPIKMFIEKRGEEFEKKSMLPVLFKMDTVDSYGAEIHSMGSMGDFEPVPSNGAYPMDSFEEGYAKFLKAVTWKKQFSISAEAMEDGNMMDLKAQPEKFMTAYERGREKFGARISAGAMSLQSKVTVGKRQFDILGADGLPIFHQEHVNKHDVGKQCNLFSDEFSVEALDAVESEMHLFADDRSETLDVEPDTILIAEDPVLKRKVFEAIGSDKDPATSENAYNYQYGRWNVIVWPYLNRFLAKGLKPWMVLDSKYNQTYGGAVWHDRLKLYVKSYIDNGTDANVWGGRARYNATFYDWRFAALGGMAGGKALVG